MISFDGNMPFSVEDFAADCDRLLSEQDARDSRIALGLEDGVVHNATLRQWRQFEQALKNEIVWMRAVQGQKNPASAIRGERAPDTSMTQVLAQASKMENLLEAEKILMQLQWQKLDELALNKDFTVDFILVYGVKLVMLERLNAFKTDEGSKELEKILEKAAQSEERRV